MLGAEGVKTATREEHFPEIASWLPDAARRAMNLATPDLAQAYQWGDTEHPGDFLGQMFPPNSMTAPPPSSRKRATLSLSKSKSRI